ncbi:MAG: hypothetical protein IPK77_09825 [Cellvibrio sp.]|nr:hypothetical protein [Cellvibrio sp.]
MSSYDCVAPISWDVLHQRILPSWCAVLEGNIDCIDFCEEFIPNYREEFLDPERYSWKKLPKGYLKNIDWKMGSILNANQIRNSDSHLELEKLGIADFGTYLIQYACKSTACAIRGDKQKTDVYFAESFYGYWDETDFQVAGTKSYYEFLKTVFHVEWNPDKHVLIHKAKENVPLELIQLLGNLFLGLRSFPGVRVIEGNWQWPSYDDNLIQGYLTPKEVKDLLPFLEFVTNSSELDDETFPMFVDRAHKASIIGLGLITFHAGL